MNTLGPAHSASDATTALTMLGRHPGFWSHAFVLSLVINLLAFAVPIHMLQVYDRVLASGHVETLLVITGAVLMALIFQGVLDSFRSRLLFGLGQVFEKTWREGVFHLLIQDAAWRRQFVSINPWSMVQSVKQYIASPWMGAWLDLPWVPLYLLVIYLFHPLMGLTAVLGSLLMILIAVINHKSTYADTSKMLNLSHGARENMDLSMRQAEALQGLGMRHQALKAWVDQLDLYNEKATVNHLQSSAASAFSKFFRFFLQVAVLTLGAYLVIRNEMSPGAIIANSILLTRALAPIELISSGWKNTQESLVALKRLSTLPASASAVHEPGISIPTQPQGKIQADNLFLHVGQPPKPMIKGVSFGLDGGDVLAVIGPSGSGKTTLLRLLLGIIEPTGGTARFDGSETAAYGPSFFKQHVGYLPQQVMLFPGTIASNIARLDTVDQEQLMAATTLAGCHDMIMQLPDGYDTPVNTHGSGLSLGQQQRIGLARALYGMPKYLFLDEPNANLDTEGDTALLSSIERCAAQGTTVICIAHRSSVLKHCNKILMLRQGQVFAFGPRDEVLKKLAPPAA